MFVLEVDGLRIAYREEGEGPPVLLLHGWPTSSHLWRGVMPHIARANRVIAVDLPGFGASSKPVGAPYTFGFFARALDGVADALGLSRCAVAGHDLGGPIALHWALERADRVERLALLNTLVYPEFSEAVEQFITACRTPGVRERLTSAEGLAAAMRLGVADEARVTDEVAAAVAAPFETDDDRLALANAGIGLELSGFEHLASRLESFDRPLRVIYGEQDRILPDIALTVDRLRRDVPHADVTALPDAGHFLQEDAPSEVGTLLAAFFAPAG